MNEKQENHYLQGRRSVFRQFLQQCLSGLSITGDPDARQLAWILEREEAIAVLRGLCARYGDNDWDENLNLADIIDKHLANYLEQGA